MEVNTSHYFPLPLENVIEILRLVDADLFDVKAGIVLQVTLKQ